MAYDELSIDEKLEYHQAEINRHQEARYRLQMAQASITKEEKAAQVAELVKVNEKEILPEDFQRVTEEATPSVEDVSAVLEGVK